MEIVLLKTVERLGTEGTVVRVKPGFARNYLIPRGLATAASPEALREVETRKRHAERKVARQREQVEQLKRKVESRSLTLKLQLGESDKAFGSVTAHEIAETLKQEGLPVEKHQIVLEEPIKALGIYEVPIKLSAEVTAALKLWVVKA